MYKLRTMCMDAKKRFAEVQKENQADGQASCQGRIFCICQTEGRSDMEFDKWVEGDVRYIKIRSVELNLKLMFKTVGAVIMRKGAK